jgi:hypothetical protein
LSIIMVLNHKTLCKLLLALIVYTYEKWLKLISEERFVSLKVPVYLEHSLFLSSAFLSRYL